MATRTRGALLCLAISASLPSAHGIADDGARAPIVIGSATESMLALQSGGKAAGSLQPIIGEAATRSYRRYLDEFGKPSAKGGEGSGSMTKPDSKTSGY